MSEVHVSDPVFEDTPATVLGRLCARNGSGAVSPIATEGELLQQADISSITVKAYDEAGTLITSTTPTISDVIYDALQTTGVFSKIARGGNFAYDCPATMFPTGSVNVRIEITFTLVSGGPVRALWDFPILPLNQS